jgi:hypothetical protein
MLTSLNLVELELVCGGQNTVTTTSRDGASQTTNLTDYAFCADKVTQTCRASSPGMLWGTNEPKAAKCTIENLPKSCGLPPTGQ